MPDSEAQFDGSEVNCCATKGFSGTGVSGNTGRLGYATVLGLTWSSDRLFQEPTLRRIWNPCGG